MAEAATDMIVREYTREEKREMWVDIHMRWMCPECGARGTITIKARGGDGLNMVCLKCRSVFQSSPFLTIGSWPMGKE